VLLLLLALAVHNLSAAGAVLMTFAQQLLHCGLGYQGQADLLTLPLLLEQPPATTQS
jgi:hypothetical protein